MPTSLRVKGYELERVEMGGIRLRGEESLCIDSEMKGCDHNIFTRLYSPEAKGARPPLELRPGEVVRLGLFWVRALHAYSREDLGREPRYRRGKGVGYIVEAGDLTLYHPGASELVEEIAQARSFKVTVMIVPLGERGLTPEEGLEAVKSVRPAIVVPVLDKGGKEAQKFKLLVYPYSQVVLLSPLG